MAATSTGFSVHVSLSFATVVLSRQICMFPALSRPFPFLLRVAFSLHPPCEPVVGMHFCSVCFENANARSAPPLHPHKGFVVGLLATRPQPYIFKNSKRGERTFECLSTFDSHSQFRAIFGRVCRHRCICSGPLLISLPYHGPAALGVSPSDECNVMAKQQCTQQDVSYIPISPQCPPRLNTHFTPDFTTMSDSQQFLTKVTAIVHQFHTDFTLIFTLIRLWRRSTGKLPYHNGPKYCQACHRRTPACRFDTGLGVSGMLGFIWAPSLSAFPGVTWYHRMHFYGVRLVRVENQPI